MQADTRKQHDLPPRDPAIWVWVAVALMAIVPLEHAVAAHLTRAPTRFEHATPPQPAAAPSGAQAPRAAGSATP